MYSRELREIHERLGDLVVSADRKPAQSLIHFRRRSAAFRNDIVWEYGGERYVRIELVIGTRFAYCFSTTFASSFEVDDALIPFLFHRTGMRYDHGKTPPSNSGKF